MRFLLADKLSATVMWAPRQSRSSRKTSAAQLWALFLRTYTPEWMRWFGTREE